MSLINDALKRAREKQPQGPVSGAPPLPPVEPPARGGNGWILALAAILFLAAAGLFVGMAMFKAKTPTPLAAKAPEVSKPPPVQPVPALVVAEPVPAPPPIKSNSVPAAVSNDAPATPSPVSPPPAVPEQLPKVQGVIFNAARPVAIVDGKAVYAGSSVGDFRVKEILKGSVVFLCPDGSQKTLKIGE